MNKFHVNVATEDEPYEALIYCQNKLHANRALDRPNDDEPPLTYTLNGLAFDGDDDNESPESCVDNADFRYKNKRKKTCAKWVKKGSAKKIKKKCRKKWQGRKIHHWCPKTCGKKAGLGRCAFLKG